jgi:hypothetical protein
MIFITSNNANVLTFIFKETDTLISVKKTINPYTYLLKFESIHDELDFARKIEDRNNTSHDLYVIMMPDYQIPFKEDVGTIILASLTANEETLVEPHQTQLDELLEKVSDYGYENLTKYEKDKLKKLSQ